MSADKIFKSGMYVGKTQKEVAVLDPQYLIDVYEESPDNGGVSREMYRLAVINLDEANTVDEPELTHEDFVKDEEDNGD